MIVKIIKPRPRADGGYDQPGDRRKTTDHHGKKLISRGYAVEWSEPVPEPRPAPPATVPPAPSEGEAAAPSRRPPSRRGPSSRKAAVIAELEAAGVEVPKRASLKKLRALLEEHCR